MRLFILVLVVAVTFGCGDDEMNIDHDEPSMMYDGIEGGIWVLQEIRYENCINDDFRDTVYQADVPELYFYFKVEEDNTTTSSYRWDKEDDAETDITTISNYNFTHFKFCDSCEEVEYELDGNTLIFNEFKEFEDCDFVRVFKIIDDFSSNNVNEVNFDGQTWVLNEIDHYDCELLPEFFEDMEFIFPNLPFNHSLIFRENQVQVGGNNLHWNINSPLYDVVNYYVENDKVRICQICPPFLAKPFETVGDRIKVSGFDINNCTADYYYKVQ